MEQSHETKENIINEAFENLKLTYDDCDIDEDELESLSESLCEYYIFDDGALNEILADVAFFEEEMRSYGVQIEFGRQCAVFDDIIGMLPVNEENARRLYGSFLEYRGLRSFTRLMDDFDEWLSKEERNEILQIAKETFIPCIWEHYFT